MGVCSATSTSLLQFSAEQVYDFITNPHNWPRTYKGSAGMQQNLNIPIQLGEEWVETVGLGDNKYYSKWTLKTAIRPFKWIFFQTNGIGATDKSCSDGTDGTTEIAYYLEKAEIEVDGKRMSGCLFKRTLTIDLPRGERIPDDLLAVCMSTAGIEGYQDAVAKELEKEHGKP
jgi:hypothetical protein